MINLAHLRALLTAAEEAHAACNADPSPGNLGIEGAAENALELAALRAFPDLLAIAEAVGRIVEEGCCTCRQTMSCLVCKEILQLERLLTKEST